MNFLKILMVIIWTFLVFSIGFKKTNANIYQANSVNQTDLDTLARTIWGEARGEGLQGMQAVANVVMNRYRQALSSPRKARQFGRTISKICKKPKQFSAWNFGDPNRIKMLTVTTRDLMFKEALYIAEQAIKGTLPDITARADHYFTGNAIPFWTKNFKPVQVVGGHKFYNLSEVA